MRILSRFLAKLSRPTGPAPGVLLAVGIVLSTATAAAQPAPPAPPAQPAQKPAPPAPPGAPPAAPGQQPAPPAQPPAQPPAAPKPVAAPPADEPLLPTGAPPAAAPPAAAPPAAPPAAPSPDVDRDAKALAKQGADRPAQAGGIIGAKPGEVFAEDWWSSARPVFEIHGNYRVRAELFHNFSLGRGDIWPYPSDTTYWYGSGPTENPVHFCGPDPSVSKLQPCTNKTQAGANMRFRLNPEIHISDNLRVMAQIDMLDNVVLGSTPEGYSNVPVSGGYLPSARGGYTPVGAFTTTQWAPVSGVNTTTNSIAVKRVWGEYMTPVGLLRFGRMPSHWGLGMFVNSGDGYDSDWQSTADRIMLVTGIKKYDLYFAGAWDFANEGSTSGSFLEQQGQPYDRGQYDDVNQYVFVAMRRRNPELQRLDLAKGNVVINGGVYFAYRNQFLANDTAASSPNAATTAAGLGQSSINVSQGYVRRGAQAYIPDLWVQFLYKKFRFEAEAAMIYGSIENTIPAGSSNYNNTRDKNNNGWKIRQFGLATQSEFRAIEDKLRIQFGFGWSSGDPDVASLQPSAAQGLDPQLTNNRTYSTFRFHPDYRVDLILFRNILTRVQGAYYFRPSVEYDFTRDKNGQRIGGGAAVIWSRASEFIQTPGHARDLGIELNATLYYQSKDGSLNDDPDRMGGFFTMLQYGVLFPLGGLSYLPGEQDAYTKASAGNPALAGTTLDTSAAQTLRWYLGIMF
jgi:uncharacterized protein (TIGR04551 family)